MTIGSIFKYAFFLSSLLLVCSFTDEPQASKKYKFITYLGCTDMDVAFLPKKTFDSLIALPLCAKDSAQNQYPIQSFEITYAERGLYQDSAGLPIIFTDYTNFKCEGNAISKEWVNQFVERTYKGDTIFIEKVKVLGPENKSREGKGMKIIIK